MDEKIPSIRFDLDYIPMEHEGKEVILVRDPLGLVGEGRVITPELFALMRLLDGEQTPRELQEELSRLMQGQLVPMEQIEGLIKELDSVFLLDSPHFRQARGLLEDEFSALNEREPTLAGSGYPEESGELETWIDQCVSVYESTIKPEGRLKGLAAPHIDLNVGQRGYGAAYAPLKARAQDMTPTKRVLLLGVGHQLLEAPFCLTRKHFRTPLGLTRNATDVTDLLMSAAPAVVSANDFPHRNEHSLEFQVLFLQRLLGLDVAIAPVLCGSLMGLPEYSRQAYLDAAGPLLEAMRGFVESEDAMVLAGVDLSHIGPKFGHEMTGKQMEREASAHDMALLTYLTDGDPDAFWEESARVGDQFNVCGFAALACLMEILPGRQGQVLHYEMWHEEPTQSAVSYAAISFTE